MIAGPHRRPTLEPALQRTLGAWTRTAPPFFVRIDRESPDSDGSVTVTPGGTGGRAAILVGWRSAGHAGHDEAAGVLVNTILGDITSTSIVSELRRGDTHAYSSHGSMWSTEHSGALLVQTSVPAERAGDVVRRILDESERLGREALPATELSRAVRIAQSHLAAALETAAGVASVVTADLLMRQNVGATFALYRSLADVTSEDVRRFAATHMLRRSARVVVAANAAFVAAPLIALGLGPLRIERGD